MTGPQAGGPAAPGGPSVPAARLPTAASYGWWLLVGALLGFGVAGLLTVGLPFLLLGAVLLGVGLRLRAVADRAAVAVPSGVALVVLYLAWLNRGGPGEVCTVRGAQTTCVEAWSPWPFVVVAAALVGTSVLLRLLLRLLLRRR